MSLIHRIFTLFILALAVTAASNKTGTKVVPPSQGVPNPNAIRPPPLSNQALTDTGTILSTVSIVNQGTGATGDVPPNHAVPETNVTAIDGRIVNATLSSITSPSLAATATKTGSSASRKRDQDGYHQVFAGAGPAGGTVVDAAVEGTAYLTYTVIPNSTYNVEACLDFCSSVTGCVFANLYYEFNNELLDFVFSEQSNLKCALYADTHTVVEKTNFGGQQSYPSPGPLTYIQDSSGWALSSLADPADPEGYELVFGPTNGANNAFSYMGFTFIDRYDVDACAALCSARTPDLGTGGCSYFNIWRAVVNGVPTTYTCSFYITPTDASTATNYGQGDLQVTYSRGYLRINYAGDGGFEGYTCNGGPFGFCYTTAYGNWQGTGFGTLDAVIVHGAGYAGFGYTSAVLGSFSNSDSYPGTLSAVDPLATKAGEQYRISFFEYSGWNGPEEEAGAYVQVVWNGEVVADIRPEFSYGWVYRTVTVTASGNDRLAFVGGNAPAWMFLDNIAVFIL